MGYYRNRSVDCALHWFDRRWRQLHVDKCILCFCNGLFHVQSDCIRGLRRSGNREFDEDLCFAWIPSGIVFA